MTRIAEQRDESVRATRIRWTEPPMYLVNDQWRGPPGAIILQSDGSFVLCCPGCGKAGSGRDGARWSVVSGSWDDVSTLSLSPSIQKSCCGWHGYLTLGRFDSC